MFYELRGGVAQCVARLTRNVEVVGSSPIKGRHKYRQIQNSNFTNIDPLLATLQLYSKISYKYRFIDLKIDHIYSRRFDLTANLLMFLRGKCR